MMTKKKKMNKMNNTRKKFMNDYIAKNRMKAKTSFLNEIYSTTFSKFTQAHEDYFLKHVNIEKSVENILFLHDFSREQNFLKGLNKLDQFSDKNSSEKPLVREFYKNDFLASYFKYAEETLFEHTANHIVQIHQLENISAIFEVPENKVQEFIIQEVILPNYVQHDFREVTFHWLESISFGVSPSSKKNNLMKKIRKLIRRIQKNTPDLTKKTRSCHNEFNAYPEMDKMIVDTIMPEILSVIFKEKSDLEQLKELGNLKVKDFNVLKIATCLFNKKGDLANLEKKVFNNLDIFSNHQYSDVIPMVIFHEYVPVKEKIKSFQHLSCADFIKTYGTQKQQERFKSLILEIKDVQSEKEAQQRLWIKEIIGESVFEKYKLNRPEKIVIHTGETNTGKTYHALEALKASRKGAYLAPLRLLALQVYEDLSEEGIHCSYITGEERKTRRNATHVSSTIEKANYYETYDCVVIDEAQMIGDKQRGSSWARAILGIQTRELHIVVAPEGLDIILKILDNPNIEINEYKRENELVYSTNSRTLKDVEKNEAVVVFSKKKVLEVATKLEKMGKNAAIIYGAMPPSVRRKQIDAFKNNEYDVVVTTDAIGMGLNLPIQKVLFLQNQKYDGIRERKLTTNEIKQIAGRAGRRGFFENGEVSFNTDGKEMVKLATSKTKPLEKIVIKPIFSMLSSFYENINVDDALEALEMFYTNWANYEPIEDFVDIEDIRKELKRINLLKRYDIKGLTIEELWTFINMPFKDKIDILNRMWIDNINCYLKGVKPDKINIELKDNIDSLELLYQKIELQMQFLDEENPLYRFYSEEKEKISDEMFILLKEKYGTPRKNCKNCGASLKRNEADELCTKCAEVRMLSYIVR